MWDALALPLSGSSGHHLAPWAIWHARLMVLAWGLLLPVGALVARYFKITPRQDWPRVCDSKFWWYGHLALQYSGVVLMLAGLALAWGKGQGGGLAAQAHASLGWGVALAGCLQVLSGWLRGSKGGPTEPDLRGDHYDMTPHRQYFERFHKGLGWLALVASMATVALGLVAADAPRWMPMLIGGWWLLLVAGAWQLQRRGRCVDTYQAIWGADAAHPGHALKPIGWGVRRPAAIAQEGER